MDMCFAMIMLTVFSSLGLIGTISLIASCSDKKEKSKLNERISHDTEDFNLFH